ncbi:MAG: DUF1508 domain-containing protein [Clostridia bacterium]|nr:DUF1508 domain-containing protein [Clostridia bacterium]
MGFFSLFKKKKKAPEAPVEEPKQETVPQPEEEAATVDSPASIETEPVQTEAPAQEESKAEPVAEAPKAPAKAAPKKNTSAGTTLPKEGIRKRTTAPARPFFVTTENDVSSAFEAAIAEAEAEIAANGAKAVGKYEFNLEVDGYHFYLVANNGQVLFDSPSFTTLLGALNGIKTFKKTVAGSDYDVKADKYGRFRFIFANKYYGENYTTKEQCTKSAESVQNFANNARIIPYKPEKEAVAAFETAKSAKRKPEDIDWVAVAKAEAEAEKMGKFEICREENGEYSFYLLANNAQILYSSRYFANEAACRRGIESFKRAAYVGNFFVDRDKFDNYRYVLKNIGSAPSFIGESYDNKPQCEKIIESVKNFIVTATVELAEEDATEE